MNKNILIIGGSYFIGRIFVQKLSKMEGYSIHVLNRGRYSLKIPGITEYKCDRRDLDALQKALQNTDFDAVVDFCAYFVGDVKNLLKTIPGRVGQYIYISSCAVFESSLDYPKYEDSPKISEPAPGPAGEYAYNKMLLELETKEACSSKNIPFTILRPSFVYGPYNYAPRESFFFNLILTNQKIPMPDKNLALFQFVYVHDIAGVLIKCLCNPDVHHNHYNLAAPEYISYVKLLEVLAKFAGRELETQWMALDEINENNVPLPFPLEQHELYAGDKITRALDFSYTPFYEGMKESFDFYIKYVHK